MLKILQGRLQQYVNQQRPNVQDGFEKAEEPEIKLPLSVGSQRKQGNSRKKHLFLLHWLKSLTVWITTNWKILKEMGMPDHLTCLLRNLYAGQKATVRNAHGTNLSQIGKGVRQGCMLSPCLFNFYAEDTIWNTWLYDSQAGTKIVGRNINNLRYANDNTLTAESEEELKSLWMTVKEESEKVGLKLNIQKMKIMASGPITSWQIDGGKVETVTCFIFLGSKITVDVDKIKRHLLLGRKAMTNLDTILKSRNITLPTKVHLIKVMVFPVVMYGYESWMIKKAERRRIDAFELWCWRRLLRVPWTARRSNQSILKEINQNIHWKDWSWSWNSNTLATWCEEPTHWKRLRRWERLKVGGEGGNRGWDGLMAVQTWWTWVWANSGGWCCRGHRELDMTEQLNWTEFIHLVIKWIYIELLRVFRNSARHCP